MTLEEQALKNLEAVHELALTAAAYVSPEEGFNILSEGVTKILVYIETMKEFRKQNGQRKAEINR